MRLVSYAEIAVEREHGVLPRTSCFLLYCLLPPFLLSRSLYFTLWIPFHPPQLCVIVRIFKDFGVSEFGCVLNGRLNAKAPVGKRISSEQGVALL
jgi:hypothetical protein